jgi:hypothetical protein
MKTISSVIGATAMIAPLLSILSDVLENSQGVHSLLSQFGGSA